MQHVREVGGEAALGDAHVEGVRKAAALETVQGAHAVAPLLRKREPVAPLHLVAGPTGVRGAHLEAGGEDEAVQLVFHAVGDHALLRDALHALALRIHQRDVGVVEGDQVVVMEARPLAELAIPRLQRVRGGRVFHQTVHAGADLLHLLEIREFHAVRHLFRRELGVGAVLGDGAQVADDVRPAVTHQVLILLAAGDEHVEVRHALVLPTGLQGLRPVWVCRLVAAHVDGRRRALEHMQALRRFREMGHALHRGGAGADDANALVLQVDEAAVGVAAGVGVIPPAGVERVPLEGFNARNPRQLGAVQGAVAHDDEACPHAIFPVCEDRPALRGVVPFQRGHFGLEAGALVLVELTPDGLRVGEDFRGEAVLLLRHVAEFLHQRQVDVGLDVALRPRVAVPVPSAAEVPTLLDDAQVAHARGIEPRRGQLPAEAATDDDDVDLVVQRLTLDALDVWVFDVVREVVLHFNVLIVAVRPQALVPLGAVLGAQGIRIKAQGGFRDGCFGHCASSFDSGTNP